MTKNNSFKGLRSRLFVRISISHSGTPIIGGNISRLSLDHEGDVQNQRPNANCARPDRHQKSELSYLYALFSFYIWARLLKLNSTGR